MVGNDGIHLSHGLSPDLLDHLIRSGCLAHDNHVG